MKERGEAVHQYLQDLGISYETIEHPPVYTCEEAKQYVDVPDAADVKNIVLRNHNKSAYYFLVLPIDKRLDIKAVTKVLGEKKMSFAKAEVLMEFLGLEPGSVSVLGVINDRENCIKVMFDDSLSKEEYRLVHPNVNTQSLKISREDIEKIVTKTGHDFSYVEL